MLVLNVPEQELTKEIPAVEREATIFPDSWAALTRWGRIKRYRGDPQGLVDLAEAARRHEGVFGYAHAWQILNRANLYRLAGRDAECRRGLLTARRLLEGVISDRGHDPEWTGHLPAVCLFLGDDEAAERIFEEQVAANQAFGKPQFRYGAVARLAKARRLQDAQACRDARGWFEASMKGEPALYSESGGITTHDWIELALTVESEITGEVSPRLREIPIGPPRGTA